METSTAITARQPWNKGKLCTSKRNFAIKAWSRDCRACLDLRATDLIRPALLCHVVSDRPETEIPWPHRRQNPLLFRNEQPAVRGQVNAWSDVRSS